MTPSWQNKSRFLLGLLFISAALNVATIGYGISQYMPPDEKTHDAVMQERMEGLLTLLPAHARTDLKDELNAQSGIIRRNLQAIRAERHHVEKLIRAQTISQDDLEQSFARLRDLHSETQNIYQSAFSHVVAKLPLEDRTQTTQAIKKRHPIKKTINAQTLGDQAPTTTP